MYGTKLYWVWDSMLNRTSNPKHKYYADYGGRGITVCKEWKESFENFYKWAINNGYKEGLTLDRTNNNGNYCYGNWLMYIEDLCMAFYKVNGGKGGYTPDLIKAIGKGY